MDCVAMFVWSNLEKKYYEVVRVSYCIKLGECCVYVGQCVSQPAWSVD